MTAAKRGRPPYDPNTSMFCETSLPGLGGQRLERRGQGGERMAPDPTWDFRSPASKGRLLSVVQQQIEQFFELAAEPARWRAPTACTGWELRDMVGHLLDATDSYLTGFECARRGGVAPEPAGVAGMAAASDAAARSFRDVPRVELLARLSRETQRLLAEIDELADAEWSSLRIPDRYLGPLPAMVIVEGLLGGYTVHGWDVRQGLGAPHGLDGDAADLLVPFVFLLWQATADTSAVGEPFALGVRTTGHNGGDTRIDVSRDGLRLSPGDLDRCGAILECDPGTFVLTGYGRINGGTVRGDSALVARFRSLFVAI